MATIMSKISTGEFVEWLHRENLNRSDILEIPKVSFDPDEFVNLITSSPKLRLVESTDGPVSTVVESSNPKDRSRQTTNFDFHTDGSYYPKPPDLVILYCVNPGRGDIKTVISDSTKILEKLKKEKDVLDKLDITYISKNKEGHKRPLVELHARTGDPVLNTVARGFVTPKENLSLDQMPELRETTRVLGSYFEAMEKCIIHSHEWQEGDLMIFDNHRYLHGRFGPGSDPDRKLYRIWLDIR